MVHVGGAVGPLEGARQRRMAVIGVEGKAVLARVAGQRIGLVLEPRRHRGPVVQRRLQGARALRHHRPPEVGGAAKGKAIVVITDRKSVVEGTSVSVRVELGGRRIIKTKNNKYNMHLTTTTKNQPRQN